MSKAFGIAFAATMIVIAALVWTGFEKTRGNHLVPTGSIGKIRVINAGDDVAFMVIDFTIKNSSDRAMVVRSIECMVQTADGNSLTGGPVAAADVKTAFQSYPLLGEQYNPVLKDRDVLPPRQTVDRMAGIRFDVPSEKLEARKRVTLRIEDITGPVLEMTR